MISAPRSFTARAVLTAAALLAACASLPNASGEPPITAQTLSEALAASGYSSIPLKRLRIGVETVALRINGQMGLFVLDTGASLTVIDSRRLAKFGIDSGAPLNSTTAIGAGGGVLVSSYGVKTIGFGNHIYSIDRISAADMSAVNASFVKDTGISVDGVLGHDVLSHLDAVIDLGSGRLFLRKP